jgi:eukaryotic-like serine/threonine-protein kinase
MAEQIGAPLGPGALLEDRYRIRGILGQGGMSRVYLADATRLQMLVAVKENLQTSPEARSQFEREAQYLARLAHPSIPRVIDSFTDADNGRQYLVMEYVEGEDLRR